MNRRAFIAGFGAALLVPSVARAQALRTDWHFRVASKGQFASDLDAFCTAKGYPLLTIDDGAGGRTISDGADLKSDLRFDFLWIDALAPGFDAQGNTVATPGTGKPHVNVRISQMPKSAIASAVLAQLVSDLSAYFASLASVSNAIPTAFGGGTQTWHSTPGGTILIDPPPTHPKAVWA